MGKEEKTSKTSLIKEIGKEAIKQTIGSFYNRLTGTRGQISTNLRRIMVTELKNITENL